MPVNNNTVSSVAGKDGDVTLVKADVSLGNVDNTSDANKPVSTTQQTALNGKANLAGGNTFTGNQNFGATPINIPQAPLNLVNSASATLLTQLNLINLGGGTGAGSALDFHTYDVSGGTIPGARIASIDNNFSADLTFSTKTPGAQTNPINERMRVTKTGQVSINQTVPDASAILQVDSATQGFLLPRMTSAQRLAITTPAVGLQVFDADLACVAAYSGTTWKFEYRQNTTAIQTSTIITYANVTEFVSQSLDVGLYVLELKSAMQSTAANTGVGLRLAQGTATISNVSLSWSFTQAIAGTAKNFEYDQISLADNITSASVVNPNVSFPVFGNGVFRISVAGTVAIQIRTEIAGNGVSIRPDSTYFMKKIG